MTVLLCAESPSRPRASLCLRTDNWLLWPPSVHLLGTDLSINVTCGVSQLLCMGLTILMSSGPLSRPLEDSGCLAAL
jgi:hypothetical protein